MQLHLHPLDLHLRHTFRISHGSRDVQPTVIVELSDGPDAPSGFGEATMTSYYGLVQADFVAELERLRPLIEQTPLTEPAAYLTALAAQVTHPFMRCALDAAAHDLWAKRRSQRLAEAWGESLAGPLPITSYTIGIAPVAEMAARLHKISWPAYKIKLGTDDDLAIIRELRRHTDAPFRVDANTGWTAEKTVALSKDLATLGVEFIEQPLPADDHEGQDYVFRHSALPIMADESCQVEVDIATCAHRFHAVNVKLMKCGGLLPARRMLAHARKLGLKTMVGCMTESSIGISTIAHLLPQLDYADMDGALLLRDDPAGGVTFGPDGRARFSDKPGSGGYLK